MHQPYWEILLEEWRSKGRNGLTIPFIIGSQSYLIDGNLEHAISELVIDIVENDNSEIYLTYCTDIDDLILGIRDNTKSNIAGRFPEYKNVEQSSFFQTLSCLNLGDSIEDIIDGLEERYQVYIDAEQFSRNDLERGDYTGPEKAFIKQCFCKI